MRNTQWARLLAYVTGMVNQRLLMQNEYLAAENRILRSHLPARVRLSDPERSTLAAIGKRLGRKALEQVACIAKPDTILGWYRKLIARKFDGSRQSQYPGRPPLGREITELVVRMARENADWGYDRIAGALANLVMRSRTKRWATSFADSGSQRLRNAARTRLGLTSFVRIWPSRRHRFLDCGSAHLARTCDVLPALRSAAGEQARDLGRNDETPH